MKGVDLLAIVIVGTTMTSEEVQSIRWDAHLWRVPPRRDFRTLDALDTLQ